MIMSAMAKNSYLRRRKALEPRHQSTSSSDGKSQNKPFSPPFTRARESRRSSWACGERGHETERFISRFGLFKCLNCMNSVSEGRKGGEKKGRLRCKAGTGSREYNQPWVKENSGQSKNNPLFEIDGHTSSENPTMRAHEWTYRRYICPYDCHLTTKKVNSSNISFPNEDMIQTYIHLGQYLQRATHQLNKGLLEKWVFNKRDKS